MVKIWLFRYSIENRLNIKGKDMNLNSIQKIIILLSTVLLSVFLFGIIVNPVEQYIWGEFLVIAKRFLLLCFVTVITTGLCLIFTKDN